MPWVQIYVIGAQEYAMGIQIYVIGAREYVMGVQIYVMGAYEYVMGVQRQNYKGKNLNRLAYSQINDYQSHKRNFLSAKFILL